MLACTMALGTQQCDTQQIFGYWVDGDKLSLGFVPRLCVKFNKLVCANEAWWLESRLAVPQGKGGACGEDNFWRCHHYKSCLMQSGCWIFLDFAQSWKSFHASSKRSGSVRSSPPQKCCTLQRNIIAPPANHSAYPRLMECMLQNLICIGSK